MRHVYLCLTGDKCLVARARQSPSRSPIAMNEAGACTLRLAAHCMCTTGKLEKGSGRDTAR